jgi:hypothetical protein
MTTNTFELKAGDLVRSRLLDHMTGIVVGTKEVKSVGRSGYGIIVNVLWNNGVIKHHLSYHLKKLER